MTLPSFISTIYLYDHWYFMHHILFFSVEKWGTARLQENVQVINEAVLHIFLKLELWQTKELKFNVRFLWNDTRICPKVVQNLYNSPNLT